MDDIAGDLDEIELIKKVMTEGSTEIPVILRLHFPIPGLGRNPKGHIVVNENLYIVFKPENKNYLETICRNNFLGVIIADKSDSRTIIPISEKTQRVTTTNSPLT